MELEQSYAERACNAEDVIVSLLRPRGILSKTLPNYEPREGQVRMAQLVENAIKNGQTVVVEAGTGTGKTFAYLLPAILSKQKVVISTGTLNLQEQIFYKDLPFLAQKLELGFQPSLMKGRTNYLCRRRWKRFSAQPLFNFAWEGGHFERMQKWAMRTKTGDRAEIKGLPEKYPAWQKISCPSHSCLGGKCPEFEGCFVTRMRREAQSADVIVVNHALFFSDLGIRGRAPGVEVIPAYDTVIFDEAHEIEETATDHFGVSVSTAAISELIRDTANVTLPSSEIKSVERALKGIENIAEAFFASLGGPTQGERVRVKETARIAPYSRNLFSSLKALASRFSALSSGDEPETDRIADRAEEMAAHLEFLIEQPTQDYVYFREAREGWSALRAAPIEIAPILKEKLFPQARSITFTSATLSVAGQFNHFLDSLGMEQDTVCLSAGTSFDPARQALLYVPRDLPDPSENNFITAASERIRSLVELTKARAFLLFTSYRAMEEAWNCLAERLPGTVLKQGDAPRSEILEIFRARPSVLFATMSFWQGVDIPGSALSMVVIDKLPFAAPGDPMVEAKIDLMKSREQDPFHEFQVPRAVLLLRQGLGRLLRHRDDKGVLALLDRRFHTKSYGRIFRESFSDHSITDDWKTVENFVSKEGI